MFRNASSKIYITYVLYKLEDAQHMTAVLYRDDYTKERIETKKKKQIGEVYIIPYRARVWCSTSQISVPSCTIHMTLFARLVFLSRLSQEFCIRRDKYHSRHVSLSYTYISVCQTWPVPLCAFRLFSVNKRFDGYYRVAGWAGPLADGWWTRDTPCLMSSFYMMIGESANGRWCYTFTY